MSGQERDSKTYPTNKYSWEQLGTIILNQHDLSFLKRSESQEHEYLGYVQQLRMEWNSTRDFILHVKFKFERALIPLNHMTENKIDRSCNNAIERGKGTRKRVQIPTLPDIPFPTNGFVWTTVAETDQRQNEKLSRVLCRNDFPYYFQDDIEHWIVWKYSHEDSQGAISMLDIEWAIQQLKSNEYQSGGKVLDTLYWVNPPHLKSIPSIDHAHILCLRGKPKETCTRYTVKMASRSKMSVKRKFIADGVFYSELNELLIRELAEDGYAGVEVRSTPHRIEIIIRATRTQSVLGEKGQRIRELTSVVQKRFDFDDNAVDLYAERVQNRGLCAQAQAESLKFKLLGGLAVRRACYGVVRFVMEASAKGCEVIVSGKLRGQRAKAMKFSDGYMIKTGHAGQVYTDMAVRHVMMRQGVIGIRVSIFLPQDPTGQIGPKIPLDDVVVIKEPKEEPSPETILQQQAAAEAARLAAAEQAMAAAAAPVEPAPMEEAGF